MVELVNSDEENIKIGQRVTVTGGHRGTILYIGPVPPNKGTYLGIDWDDPTRGKHDGVYEGVRYFTARNPTSGSFVRKEKVNLGRSCTEAIKLRYGDNPLFDEEQLLQVKKALNAPFLEMVGFEAVNKKQSCFENLEIVWLHDYAVSCAGEPNELKQLCPKIRELDLSKNLLSNWFDIAEITRQLNNLSLLNLSENVLRVPDNNELEELNKVDAFASLKYIVLTNMNYTWCDILQCSTLWPNVQHLQVPFNNISSLQLPDVTLLKNLSHLDLEGNNIKNWEEINKLGVLPKLQLLNLTNTGISEVSITSSDHFRSLKHLILSQNNISCWTHISELNTLNLEELRFRDNPVLKYCTKETSRQLIISKIASLKMLNGQEVTREERRGAEYDYIKKYGQLWDESKDNDALRTTFIKEHSRYIDLTKKYGEAESSEYVVVSSKLKSSLLKLEIIAQPTGQVIRKSLPRTMLVQRFSSLIQKLFNTGTVVPVLYVISKKNTELKVPMENNLKNLDFYSIEDGDKILVEW